MSGCRVKCEDILFSCKNCRNVLFNGNCLVDEHGITTSGVSECSSCCLNDDKTPSTVWYLNEKDLPEWMEDLINEANWIRGKLLCPKCKTRLGLFDYVSGSKCQCGQYVLPAVHVVRAKVDVKDPNSVPFIRRPSGLKLEFATSDLVYEKHEGESTKEISRTAECFAQLVTVPETSTINEERLESSSHDILQVKYDFQDSDLLRQLRGIKLESVTADMVVYEKHEDECTKEVPQAAESSAELVSITETNTTNAERLDSLLSGTSQNNLKKIRKTQPKECEEEKKNEKVDAESTLEPTDDVICPVCLDIYMNPFICYPCVHVFCEICLRHLAKSDPQKTLCPLCRQPIGMCLPDHDRAHKVRTQYPKTNKSRQKTLQTLRNFPLPWQPHYRLRQLSTIGRSFLWSDRNASDGSATRTLWDTVSTVGLLISLQLVAMLAFFVGYHGGKYALDALRCFQSTLEFVVQTILNLEWLTIWEQELYRFKFSPGATLIVAALSWLMMAALCCRTHITHENAVENMAEATVKFALQLYKELTSNSGSGNIIFSPLSIALALHMVRHGAKGNTRKQLDTCLGVTEGTDEALSNTMTSLTTETSLYTLLLANKMYVQESYVINKDFVKELTSKLAASLGGINFSSDPSEARQVINSWVQKKTAGIIKNLLPDGTICALTRLVLVNAVYFKGKWLHQFHPQDTRSQDFHCLDGATVQTQFMRMTKKFIYSKNQQLKCTMLALPYIGSRLNLVVLLPDEKHGLTEVEAQLNYAQFQNVSRFLKTEAAPGKVIVNLPKFKMDFGGVMNDVLMKLGVEDMFGGAADLTGIKSGDNLYVSTVAHQAALEVNEEGSEAAAATSVDVTVKCFVSHRYFIADHPFLFFIHDKITDTILFMGRFTKPPS